MERDLLPSPLSGSHPARGVWIEIQASHRKAGQWHSRTPQGVRGLKFQVYLKRYHYPCRTPQGVRGLKYLAGQGLALLDDRRTPQGVRGLK